MKTALRGGTLIDATGADPISPAVLVMDGDWITAVGREGEVEIPADAQVIDVTGQTILPGMINSHAHLHWDGVHDLKEQCLTDTTEVVSIKAAMNLRRSLQAGVTTIRETGSRIGLLFEVQRAKAAGLVTGPRIFHCGSHLCITGGHTYFFGHEVDSVDEVRKAVRWEIKHGATWIKLMGASAREEALSGTLAQQQAPWLHLPARPGQRRSRIYPDFTRAEIETAVFEAHRAGRRVCVDVFDPGAMRDFFEAGVDCLEHGGPLDEELIQMMVDKGIWLVPTLSPSYLQVEHGEEIGLAPFEIERRRQSIARGGRGTKIAEAAQAGVKIAMGTDAGSPAVPHNEVVREIEIMVELGICETPMDGIITSTRHGAELLGVAEDLGTLEPGKLADVIVVEGDPLRDLSRLRDVKQVFLGGELVARDGVVLSA
jgi:imidazolonepropionase-like amidohydrolase